MNLVDFRLQRGLGHIPTLGCVKVQVVRGCIHSTVLSTVNLSLARAVLIHIRVEELPLKRRVRDRVTRRVRVLLTAAKTNHRRATVESKTKRIRALTKRSVGANLVKRANTLRLLPMLSPTRVQPVAVRGDAVLMMLATQAAATNASRRKRRESVKRRKVASKAIRLTTRRTKRLLQRNSRTSRSCSTPGTARRCLMSPSSAVCHRWPPVHRLP